MCDLPGVHSFTILVHNKKSKKMILKLGIPSAFICLHIIHEISSLHIGSSLEGRTLPFWEWSYDNDFMKRWILIIINITAFTWWSTIINITIDRDNQKDWFTIRVDLVLIGHQDLDWWDLLGCLFTTWPTVVI